MSTSLKRKAERMPNLFEKLAVMPNRDSDAILRCQNNLAFMRPLPAESMQLIVTSPPIRTPHQSTCEFAGLYGRRP